MLIWVNVTSEAEQDVLLVAWFLFSLHIVSKVHQQPNFLAEHFDWLHTVYMILFKSLEFGMI